MVITLIGYRATGKSSVGPELAVRLGWSFVDTDHEIETQAGKSISEIFADNGEDYFRELERAELAEKLSGHELVISAGGGAILAAETRERMKQAGPVIWLQASPETISERLQSDVTTSFRRPSLTGTDVFQEISAVLESRQPLYREAATITLSTEGRSVSSLVDEIVAKLPTQGDPQP